jgi:hypothetical protein
MKIKREAIKDREKGRPTLYFPAGRTIEKPEFGRLPAVIVRMWEDGEGVEATFKRQ